MRPSSRVATALAWAAAALACGLFMTRALAVLEPEVPLREQFEEYAKIGQPLVHDLPGEEAVSFRMPLASVLAERLKNHSPVGARTAGAALLLVEALLVLAVAALLAPATPWAPPAALLLLLPLMRDNFYMRVYLETFYALLLLLVAGLLVARARAPSLRASFALAAAFGITLLVRSPLSLFPPLLVAFEGLLLRRDAWRSYWKHAAVLCVVPYLFLLPWIGMNYRIYHEFVPFERAAADTNIVTGVLGLVNTIEGDEPALLEKLPAPARRDITDWAVQEVLRRPRLYLSAVLKRLASVLLWQPLLFLGVALALYLNRERREYQELGLLVLYFVALHCLMPVQERYFLPLWPLLAALSAGALGALRPLQAPARAPLPPAARRFLAGAFAAAMLLALHALWTASAYRRPHSGLDEQIAAHPDEAWLRAERARERLRRGDVAGAVDDLRRAARLEPDNPEHGPALDWALLLAGDPTPLLARAIPSRDIPAHVMKALAHIHLGQAPRARGYLRSALAIHALMVDVPDAGPQGRLVHAHLNSYSDGFVDYLLSFGRMEPPDRRLVYVQELLRLVPDSAPLLTEQAQLAARLGDRALARRSAARAADLALRGADARRVLAFYAASGRHEEMLRLAEGLLARDPGSAALWVERALAEASLGRREEALRSLERAFALEPSFALRLRGASLYQRLHEYDRAREILAHLLVQAPRDASIWVASAELAAGMDDRPAAMRALEQATALRPDDELVRRVARVHSAFGGHREAMRLMVGLVARHPDAPENRVAFARFAAAAGERGAALEALAAAAARAPSPAQRRMMVSIYRQLREHRRAREALAPLLARAPSDASLWVVAAELAMDVGDRQATLRALAKATALRPGDELLRRVAHVHSAFAGYREAMRLMAGLAARHPDAAEDRVAFARYAASAGERGAALEALKAAAARSPSSAQSQAMVFVYRQLREYGRARERLAPLLGRAPWDASLWVAAAELAADVGDEPAARDALAKAMALEPGDELVGRVALVRSALGDHRQALEFLARRLPGRPGASEHWLVYARLAAVAGERESALATLREGSRRPLPCAQKRALAALYLHLNEHERAYAVLRPLALEAPRDALLRVDLAHVAAAAGDRPAAVRYLAEAGRLDAAYERYSETPRVLWRLGQRERAVRAWEASLAGAADPVEAWLSLAIATTRRRTPDAELVRLFLTKARALGPGEDALRRISRLESSQSEATGRGRRRASSASRR